MGFEIEIPKEWPPGLGFAFATMVRKSLKEGFPVIIPIRDDITPDELEAAFDIVRTVIRQASLAA